MTQTAWLQHILTSATPPHLNYTQVWAQKEKNKGEEKITAESAFQITRPSLHLFTQVFFATTECSRNSSNT